MDRIRLLRNPIRDYAWGSRTALAELMGRPSPAAKPEAELWMGTHPAAPSEVREGSNWISLPEYVRRSPAEVLGPEVAAAFGGELPFLFKVLASERALSIQTHPDAERARAGFERENAAGRALDDPRRNYRDANPKPELLCALTRFEALCGFRPVPEILEGFGALRSASLREALADLRAAPGREGLVRFFSRIMTSPPEAQRGIAGEVAEAAARGPGGSAVLRWVCELARQYPGDVGVLGPLLLNLVELEPGEALFLAAGELHSYLRGLGVELMANSDNVLRGGLTPKHVDVPELLETLSFRSGRPEILEPRPLGAGEAVYQTPAREFVLSVLRPSARGGAESRNRRCVEILLCAEGQAEVRDAKRTEVTLLPRGAAVLVPAAVEAYRLEGHATVFRAGVPAPQQGGGAQGAANARARAHGRGRA
jgi:mannose-6-phosphate isomerase